MSTVQGFASMVISGFVSLNFLNSSERMFDIPPGEMREGVPPPKYTVLTSEEAVSLYHALISFNNALTYSSSGTLSGVNDVKLQ